MRLRDGVSTGFGLLACALSIFAVGGRPRWGMLLAALAVGGALAPLVTSRRVFGRRSPLVVLAALAAAMCALQLIPLPHGLLGWLDPTNVALRDDGAALAGFSAGHTITLDVPGTIDALTFFLTLLGLAIVALRTATSEPGRFRIIAAVAILCTAYAIVAGVHRFLGTDVLYGVYPNTGGQQMLGPLINGNQTACLMAIGTVLSIGLVMYPRQRPAVRAAWLACGITCGVVCLMTLSRGGALALGVGSFVAIATLVAQHFGANDVSRRRPRSFLSSSLPIGVVSLCAVVVALYASAGGVKDQFAHTSFDELHAPRSKFAAWRSAAELIDETPWVGIGRGAFEPVFQRVHPASAYATYTHLENEYLQAVVDWGVPGAMLLAFVAIWMVMIAIRRWRDGPLAAGALGSLAVVLLQSNVDFGIEFLGLAAPITVVVATLVYVPLREPAPQKLVVMRGIRATHVVALAIGALLLATDVTTTLADDHHALEDDPSRALADVSRHPFDYYGYARLAETMLRSNEPGAVRLLNHALTLHPTDAGLHLAAARMLLRAGHADQAAIEYAAALAAARDSHHLLAEIVEKLPRSQAAMAIPTDVDSVDVWLHQLEELPRPDIEILWLERVVLLHSRATHACERLFAIAAEHADLDAIDVQKQRCLDYTPSYGDRIALALALRTKHASASIVQLLGDVESWEGRTDQKAQAWQLVCEAKLELGKLDDAKGCLRRLEGMGDVSPELASKLADDMKRIDEAERAPGSNSSQ
jgi:O-antigen ligase